MMSPLPMGKPELIQLPNMCQFEMSELAGLSINPETTGFSSKNPCVMKLTPKRKAESNPVVN